VDGAFAHELSLVAAATVVWLCVAVCGRVRVAVAASVLVLGVQRAGPAMHMVCNDFAQWREHCIVLFKCGHK
jgi:hypothetical protein